MEKSVSERRRRFLKKLGVGAALLGLGSQLPVPKVFGEEPTVVVDPKTFVETASYLLFKSGSAFCGKDGSNGEIIQKSDALSLFQYVESAVPENSKIAIRQADYVMSRKWVPTKKLRLHGEGLYTRILPDGAFDALDPTNLALFNVVWRDQYGVDHDASFDPNMFEEALHAKTPHIYNVTLTSADTEYSQALPDGTKKFSVQERDDNAFRLAFETGKVAAPAEPYLPLESQTYYEDGVYTSGVTLYLASSVADSHIVIIAWT